MQFPVSQPDDGLIDIAIQEIVRLFFFLAVNLFIVTILGTPQEHAALHERG